MSATDTPSVRQGELRALHRLQTTWTDVKFFRASCFHDDGGAAQGVDEGEEQEQETPEEPRWFVPTRSTFGLEELDFGRKTSSSSSSFSASLHRSSVQLFASEFDEVDLHEDLEQLGLGGDEDQRGGPEESEEKSDGEDEQRGNAHYDAHEGQTWVASMPSSSGGSASPASSSIVLEERQSSPLPSAMFRLRSIPQSLRLSRNDSRRQDDWKAVKVQAVSRKGQYDGMQDSDGKKSGVGRLVYSDGSQYEGEWEKDQRHGFGTMTYSSGEKYQGQWVQNLKEGTGTYTWRDQHTVYSGEWKNDQRCGKAIFKFHSGLWSFEGEWKDDVPVSEGKLNGPNLVYTGQVMALIGGSSRGTHHPTYRILAHGHGTGSYTSGDRYFGNWKKGKRDGFGVYYSKQGDCFFGNWRDDQPKGMGLWLHQEGGQYFGEVDKGRPSGKGQLQLSNGDLLDGLVWNGNFIFKAMYTSVKKSTKNKLELNPKWTLFVGEALDSFTLTPDELVRLASAAYIFEHPLENLIDRWLSLFKWSYDPLLSNRNAKECKRQLPHAVEDVNTFIEHLVQEVRLEDNCGHNRALLRSYITSHILNHTHFILFALYRNVYKKMDTKLAIQIKSLSKATPRELGVAEKFQLTSCPNRPSGYSCILGQHKSDAVEKGKGGQLPDERKQKKPPYKEAIKLLNSLPTVPAHKKAQVLLQVSEAVCDAVKKFWKFRADQVPLLGAEDKFPVLTYVLTKAVVPNFFSEFRYLSDFIRHQSWARSLGTMGIMEAEGRYRLAELDAAIRYLLSLDWNVRDASGLLVPPASLEQGLRALSIASEHITPKQRALAHLISELLVEVSHLRWDQDRLRIDIPSAMGLMFQQPQWTTHLFTIMGLALDPPLPPDPPTDGKEKDDSIEITFSVRHCSTTYLRFAELLARIELVAS